MNLNPSEDIKINKFSLDEEAANMSHLIFLYDQEWHNHSKIANHLEAQIKNLEDSLKVFRLQQFARIKKDPAVGGFDKALTDKAAEAYPYCQSEYIDMFNELKDKREEYAAAKINSDLYQNFHYQLLDKSRQIDLLYKMFAAQYFTTRNSGGSDDKEELNVKDTKEVTQELNLKLRRRTLKN